MMTYYNTVLKLYGLSKVIYSKSFCLYELYLSKFIVLEIKTKKKLKYLHRNYKYHMLM